jgi:hypothetical protein
MRVGRLHTGKGALLFGHAPYPPNNILGGIRLQTSTWGLPIPIVYGRNRIAPNLLDYLHFTSEPVNSKGGKGGLFGAGGKSGQQTYDYGAAIVMALCQGPIVGVGSVWDTQGTLPVNNTSESYTVPSGGGSYEVTQYATFIADLGVTEATSYSVSANDYGSPGPVTLTGTQNTPLTSSQYSQSNGTYSFPGSLAGAVLTINYSYGPPNSIGSDPITSVNLTFFDGAQGQTPFSWLTTNYPSHALGYTLLAYAATSRLDLGTSGALPNLTFEIYGRLQFGNGQYDCNPSDIVSDILTNTIYGGGISASEILFPQNAVAIGTGNAVKTAFALPPQYGRLKNVYLNGVLQAGSAWSVTGVLGQTPILQFASAPGSGVAVTGDFSSQYSDYCVSNGLFFSPILNQQQNLGEYLDEWLKASNSELVRVGFELAVKPYGDTSAVGNGATFLPYTNPVYDLDDDDFIRDQGSAPVLVKRASIQDAYNSVKIQFTDRANNYNSNTVEAGSLWAQTLYKYRPESPRNYDFVCQATVAALIAQTLLVRMVYIRNEFTFKVRGDSFPLDPMDIVTITDTNLGLVKAPVRITSITENQDRQLEIQAEEFPWGCSGPTLYPKEPGAANYPQASADPSYTNPPIAFEAVPRLRGTDPNQELWLALSGNSIPVSFVGGGGTGAYGHAIIVNGTVSSIVVDNQGTGYATAPAVIFGGTQGSGATATATVSGGNVISASVSAGGSGYASAWGGCTVWLSTDGTTYTSVGQQNGPAVMGKTTADWPAAADPDTTNDLPVDLSESGGTLPSVSTTLENTFATLFYVAGGAGSVPYELGAYGVATLTAPDKYTLKATGSGNFLRRNVFGAPSGPSGGVDHPSGSAFCLINQDIFKISIDPALVGKTLYLKFTSFNVRGAMEQSLATVPAYTIAPNGELQGLYNFGYSVTLNILTQDGTTLPQIDIADFYITGIFGNILYKSNAPYVTPNGAILAGGGIGGPGYSGGSGYAAGDTGTVNGGSSPAGYTVVAETGGSITAFSISPAGLGYSVANGVTTTRGGSQPGSGSGFTFNITSVVDSYGSAWYVWVYDPGFQGCNPALSIAPLYFFTQTAPAVYSPPGWMFIGAVQLNSGGGGTQVVAGGQQYPQTSSYSPGNP